jgi:hypothetical protein
MRYKDGEHRRPKDGARVAESDQQMPEAPQAPVPLPTPADVDRFRRRRRLALLGLALAGAVLVVLVVVGYQTFTKRLAAAEKLDRATALVEDADAIVVQIDEVIRAEVTPELAERARGASERVERGEELLDDAIALIAQATDDLTDDERERAALLRSSAETRLDLLEVAPKIVEANAQAASALPLADEGWQALLDADKLSDRAVTRYNKLTKAGVAESQKLNRQAATKLALARSRFDSAENAFPGAPFEDYLAYVDLRIRLNRLSQQSDKAWLAKRIAKANSIIASYNREDRKAVAKAKQLTDPAQTVADAFDEVTGDLSEEYYEARDRALEADQALRDY